MSTLRTNRLGSLFHAQGIYTDWIPAHVGHRPGIFGRRARKQRAVDVYGDVLNPFIFLEPSYQEDFFSSTSDLCYANFKASQVNGCPGSLFAAWEPLIGYFSLVKGVDRRPPLQINAAAPQVNKPDLSLHAANCRGLLAADIWCDCGHLPKLSRNNSP